MLKTETEKLSSNLAPILAVKQGEKVFTKTTKKHKDGSIQLGKQKSKSKLSTMKKSVSDENVETPNFVKKTSIFKSASDKSISM